MSAFVCMPEHIGLLAAALTWFGRTAGDPRVHAEFLARENITSVAYRYPADKGDGDRPGPNLTDEQLVEAARLYAAHYVQHFPTWLNAADLSSMVRCYEYQSCEHPGWRDSVAMMLIAKLDGACKVIGPETVHWEFEIDNPLPEVAALYPACAEAA